MITQNLHMHSTWDDGSCPAEEMILASKAAGLMSVGLSVHGPMPIVNDWQCPKERLPDYIAEVRALKEKYAGVIDVYMGVEWDTTAADLDLAPYDYVIGSVHELPIPGGGTRSVDSNAETTEQYIRECFGGDADAAAEAYFAELSKVAQRSEVDIVGHFDLITKFDEQHRFYDENSPQYRRAAERAMEGLVRAGKIFEVNTGAISRGYRTAPYPSAQWLRLLREMGGKVTVSADAHHTSGVTCAFDLAERMIKEAGFEEVWVLEGKEFVPVKI
ncbi:MAG: histidinol-phosphatase HisJ family protein [Clostridiales bacterium]|nr:histidinol-phosphatase HisJ family protein [Clostridiales bacterium]